MHAKPILQQCKNRNLRETQIFISTLLSCFTKLDLYNFNMYLNSFVLKQFKAKHIIIYIKLIKISIELKKCVRKYEYLMLHYKKIVILG